MTHCAPMKSVSDLMTPDPVTLFSDNNLYQGRCTMRNHGIRHLPILTPGTREFAGVLTQKVVLSNAINVIDTQGIENLTMVEEQTEIVTIMDTDAITVSKDTPLLDAAKFFQKNRHGCIIVIEEKEVVGILTSGDFIKFAIYVLESDTQ